MSNSRNSTNTGDALFNSPRYFYESRERCKNTDGAPLCEEREKDARRHTEWYKHTLNINNSSIQEMSARKDVCLCRLDYWCVHFWSSEGERHTVHIECLLLGLQTDKQTWVCGFKQSPHKNVYGTRSLSSLSSHTSGSTFRAPPLVFRQRTMFSLMELHRIYSYEGGGLSRCRNLNCPHKKKKKQTTEEAGVVSVKMTPPMPMVLVSLYPTSHESEVNAKT